MDKGQVDEIAKLEAIGMQNHAEFLKSLNKLAASGDDFKTEKMGFSAQIQARVVRKFMATKEYREMMERLEYNALFRNRGKRALIPEGEKFVWKFYNEVHDKMICTRGVNAAPSSRGGVQKRELVSWLTASSAEGKTHVEALGRV